MKVCLVFQRRFTPTAHKVAIELKRQGVDEFCGYVYRHSSLEFLERQKDIRYSSLLLDGEVHEQSLKETADWDFIDTLEKDIGMPNLWPYIAVDRVIRYGQSGRDYPFDTPPYTHEEMARLLAGTAKTIRAFLEREKPDLIYLPAVSSLGNMLLFHLGKKMGATVFFGAETRIEGGYALSENYRSFSFALRRFEELGQAGTSVRKADAEKWIDHFREKPRAYHYLMESFKGSGHYWRAFAWLSPIHLTKTMRWIAERILHQPPHEYSEQRLFPFFADALRRKFRLMRGFDDLYDRYDSKENFVYFPLHLEPEVALLLLAPRWTNQLNLIKQIAESLPFSFKLYVKEHPAMVGFRTRRYYRELKKIPNVKLIHPNHDSMGIVRDAKIVTTITGTAGWEALLFKKPVITFGDVYYNALSMVKKCTEIGALPLLVKEQLERFAYDEQELVNFIAALLENSENIQLHELWEKGLEPSLENKSVERFATLLMRTYRACQPKSGRT